MNRIELIQTEPGYFTVIVDDKFAHMCSRDEALGVVAAVLFGGTPAPFLKSYAQWDGWQILYDEDPVEPVALIEDKRVLAQANTRLWPKEFLVRELTK